MSDTLQEALAVGKQLVEYINPENCRFRDAIVDLYADDAKHIEACDMGPDMPQITDGKEAILKMSDWWESVHEVHGHEVKGPYPHGNGSFATWMSLDVTAKEGPMANQRMQMQEVCVYGVKDGKISQVEFYWDPTESGE
ncbi:MAG: nuclear transport factor 2 family protein [Planctomycetota bacterium]